MPTAPKYETGKAGTFSIGGASAYFSDWEMTIEKEYADATDSSGFDPSNQQLWKKQAAGAIAGSGTISGFYDFNAGSSTMMAVLLADDPVAAAFGYNQTTPFAAGLVTVKNFKTGVKIDGTETIGFDCDFDTYGPMEILS